MANATFNIHKTGDKEAAYRSVINVWIKSSPENFNLVKALIKQNKRRQVMLRDAYGRTAFAGDDMRIGLSLPTNLYYTLVAYERMHGREFMKTKEELRWFARKFPQFVICERI